jgi:sodium-dependent phosphate cotransporter
LKIALSISVIEVRPAIPIVMGANIGTSVTNTLVSMAQAADKDQFRRAFAGAVVHDIFNWLSVLVFLPLEVVSHYLFYITDRIVGVMNIKTDKGANKELLKKITKPFTKVIIQLDKKVIQNIALKVAGEENKSLIKTCSLKKTVLKNVTELVNITGSMANQTVERNVTIKETVKCDFLFSNTGMSDTTVGVILLIIALFILCACLICIVKLLHSMLRGQLASVIKRTVNSDFPKPFHHLTGYFAIIVGSAMTILVQSSSIFTSALTPLIGVGVVSIERAYPLTLGANIGTTATGILAALASDGTSLKRALQIALCHLFFNISGILLWYPIPCMRRVPIRFAKFLGNTTAEYRWFALAYLVFGFFLLPASVFGLSLAGWQILLGVAVPILVLLLFILITNVLQSKRPSVLPDVLKDWEWAPKWTRSLEPHDKVMKKAYEMSKGRCGNKRTTQITKQQVETVV